MWGLGIRPIDNIIALFGSKGVRFMSLAEDCREVDTCSAWVDNIPFTFINPLKSVEQSRLDAAHELGCFVLHQKTKVQGKVREREADKFALDFLMPRRGILAAPPPTICMETLIEFKKKWRVSLAASAHRLHMLNRMKDWDYRMLCIRISNLDYEIHEPHETSRDEFVILKQAFQTLRKQGWTIEWISESLHIPVNKIKSLTFGAFV